MKNRLTRITAVIDDHPITIILKPNRSNGLGNIEQVPDKFAVLQNHTLNVRDMFLGDNKQVNRRLGINVLKDKGVLVFMDDLCLDLSLNDFAKKTVWVPAHLFSPGVFPENRL